MFVRLATVYFVIFFCLLKIDLNIFLALIEKILCACKTCVVCAGVSRHATKDINMHN